MSHLVTFLFFLFLSCPEKSVNGNDIKVDERKELESELSLAKKDRIYTVFDLRGQKILLKAKGMILQEFHVKNVKARGDAFGVELIVLEKKASFQAPERVQIKPGDKSAGGDDIAKPKANAKALELSDMPTNFVLHFKEGLEFTVVADSSEEGFSRYLHLWSWEFTTRLPKSWGGKKKGRFADIRLLLEPGDAKALYWSLSENAETLIIPAI